MKDTDYLRELAKEAKKAGKQNLVVMYCNNYKRLVKKEKALTVAAANA